MKIDKHNPPSISDFSTLPTWLVGFTHPKTVPHLIAYIRSVFYDFFIVQYIRKAKLLRTPILNVENELDKKVPFVPKHIFDYLGFVNFWIRPLGMLIKVLGIRKSAPLMAKFFSILRKSYKRASEIYNFCMTTTNRPLYKRTRFVIMRALDPHYLCVPSLHIAIVCLCYAFFKDILQSKDFSEKQRELWTNEIYAGAIKIAETVLYVKQHSVNCIPAALYMMTNVIPQLFSKENAQTFLEDMFKTRSDIPQTEKTKVIEYMQNLFNRFYEQGKTSSDWSLPIKNWMSEYAKNTNQKVFR